ncbi:MAG: DUF1778 domain-containing protein [Micrococcales bacterium]|nr:DUF1778 domain-containing protein [Micrococcales bacterium]
MATKDERIALRVTGEQKATIAAAADMLGRSVTDFAVATTLERANEVLADQRVFHVSADRLAQFERLLTAPVTPNRGLADLFATPSIFAAR